ncbi:xanthine dehydrogenase molybdenum binding subunit apoprotein [Sinobacterium caligoides]|uniref:Xanthine dehydrogenase molybdenum binding subunit apoprotein n=1 Tax=Sinobacterium caligoides TaxID=933926 RepID=A0A3N2E0L5_9GAMM|nr:xanthine dehydrogenase molybdopterin binding subunit [Sinobacterium caligoides]ROS05636.1 xanthine dehydrogenase molybdenum binding subunit apoprotein [Sinobacterium caligoides]
MRSMPNSQTTVQQAKGHAGSSTKHESAHKHVSGEAIYVDDMPEPAGTLYAYCGFSPKARGKINKLDLGPVRQAEGVVAVLTADDVPGHLDIGAVFPGEPLLAQGEVEFLGQPIFVVAATSYNAARRAARLAEIKIDSERALITVADALEAESFVRPPHSQQRGDAAKAIKDAPIVLEGEQFIGGQEHFYLEGQVSLAIPAEDRGMMVYSSSQHPAEVQKLVAEVLDVPMNLITVDMRRMGGGFGGKETQAAQWACLAALVASKTGRACKMRLARSDDMSSTGKRHPFYNQFTVGVDEEGLIQGADITVNGHCGYAPDLSDAIVDRAMFHSDNAYYLGNAKITGNRCKTNTVSNTAYRGFGGPKGVILAERMMDDIARRVGKDPLDVRKLNLYTDEGGRNVTHYHQTVEHNILEELIEQLEESSNYRARRAAITEFNQHSPIMKKGLALTPVKFGISFTVQHLNQAGALIHIYTDGSIQVNHGGTEMGQGLHTKVAQIVAAEFGVDIDDVLVTATRTDKVPNTSPTAASSGTDLNGKAAQNAALTIKQRLIDFASEHFGLATSAIKFADGEVQLGAQTMSFAEFSQLAYMNRVSLSSTGYYKTPKIHYDREKAAGRPFFYFAMGASCAEVLVDTLTGEYQLSQVDILHDVGTSLNPAIDIGQIEGAFAQGLGWVTTEELVWNNEGRLLTNNGATYKIPAVNDLPEKFNVELFERANPEDTILNSKAVGEPPFMHGIAVLCAIRDAVSSLADYRVSPELHSPATPEKVLWAVNATRAQAQAEG